MDQSQSDGVRNDLLQTIATGIGIAATMISMSFCYTIAVTVLNYYTSWDFLPTLIVALILAATGTYGIWQVAKGRSI